MRKDGKLGLSGEKNMEESHGDHEYRESITGITLQKVT